MQVEAVAGTPEWIAARRGILTASRMKDAAAILKSGKPGAERAKLMMDLAAERLTGIAVSHYVSAPMQWGLDNQAGALLAYEAITGALVGREVFILHPEIEGLGATPDALVGRDGLVEVKCPTTPTHLAWLLAGVVPEEHRLQMATQAACARRAWVDFVSFDPRMPSAKQVFMVRYTPTPAEIEEVEAIAREFIAELNALIERVLDAEAA